MSPSGTQRLRFRGHIAGVGSEAGVRVVVGRWDASPFGAFADAMVERADGSRLLLAPSPEVAQFVAATYEFDEIRVEPFAVRDAAPITGHERGWVVEGESLRLEVRIGRTTALGRLLAVVPRRVAEAPWWCTLTDVVARVVLRGVRTRGRTKDGARTEWYGATGNRAVTGLRGTFEGADVGELRPVVPAPRFGFSSTPPRPSVTRVVTTVELPPTDAGPPPRAGTGRAR